MSTCGEPGGCCTQYDLPCRWPQCAKPAESKPCESGHALGQCGEPTTLRCCLCGRPVCAGCSEESWLNECDYTCEECWAKENDL